ncbi:hypothetical protein ACIO3O_41895 [Streptomyces sp. NPDC087440]
MGAEKKPLKPLGQFVLFIVLIMVFIVLGSLLIKEMSPIAHMLIGLR